MKPLRLSFAVLCSLATACSPESDPSAPDALFAKEGRERTVSMMDACDPASFNAVLGEGACTRSGGVTFDKFIALLEQNQKVGSWHNSPGQLNVQVGDLLVAINRGGEAHTFTEVEEFGGGIVPDLNVLSGNPVPAPECNPATITFIPPGGRFSESVEEEGDELYQCCLHPWMRTTVQAR